VQRKLDFSTLTGILSGFILIMYAIYNGGTLRTYLNFNSFLITLGGTIAATIANYPFSKIAGLSKVLRVAFTEKSIEADDVIGTIINLAENARREGLLALEDAAYQLEDDFMQKGILLIVDGTDPELVRNIMETELVFLEERHGEGQGIFETMGTFAPAFGLLGTVIGLINMLTQLDNPDTIGSGMAVALITTFYGSLLANMLFLPLAGKLKVRSSEEILIKEVMIEGMLSIQAGENPRIIEEKLKAFLAPAIRNGMSLNKNVESGEDLAWQQQTARL
jgi:chemotaxis protein MotA